MVLQQINVACVISVMRTHVVSVIRRETARCEVSSLFQVIMGGKGGGLRQGTGSPRAKTAPEDAQWTDKTCVACALESACNIPNHLCGC